VAGMANTNIKFSSVETAVSEILNGRTNMESELENFANVVRNLIMNGDFIGTAADTFETSFEDLKKKRFEAYISLVQDFADTISKASRATQDTAQALDSDASQNLYR
jgi:uncharacterized protein YukE